MQKIYINKQIEKKINKHKNLLKQRSWTELRKNLDGAISILIVF
jgi:hypothetical protein